MKRALTGILISNLICVSTVYATPDRFTEKACYVATYDAAHMAQHPKQKVRELRMILKPSAPQEIANDDSPNEDGLYNAGEAQIAAYFKDSKHGWYSDEGFCRSNTAGQWICGIECDGGQWAMSRLDSGAMLLKLVTDIRVTSCDEGTREIRARDDQKSFILKPAPWAKCADFNLVWIDNSQQRGEK